MRKINTEFKKAFQAHRPLTKSNTSTDGNAVWLHGNKIIERRGEEVWISAAGWATSTTKSRINGIVGDFGSLYTKQGQLYFAPVGQKEEIPIADDEWVNLGR